MLPVMMLGALGVAAVRWWNQEQNVSSGVVGEVVTEPSWTVDHVEHGSVRETVEAEERRVLRLDTWSASAVVEDVVSRTWSRTISIGAGGEAERRFGAKIAGVAEAGVRAALKVDGRWTREESLTERKSIRAAVVPGGAVEVLVTWRRLEQHGVVLLADASQGRSLGEAVRAPLTLPYRAMVGLTCDVEIRDLPRPPGSPWHAPTGAAPVAPEIVAAWPGPPSRVVGRRPPRASQLPTRPSPVRSAGALASRPPNPVDLQRAPRIVDEARYFGIVFAAVLALLLVLAPFV